MKTTLITLYIASICALALAQSSDCPMHAQHMAEQAKTSNTARGAADGSSEHGAGVDHRHDTLGVAHETTHHSFRLYDDGAAIELRANGPSDTTTIEAIRAHMRVIADQFRANNFSTPMFVHDKTPDGIETIKQLHAQIDFNYESLPAGARVRIKTANSTALSALHAFMRFQIVEHRTSDSGAIERDAEAPVGRSN